MNSDIRLQMSFYSNTKIKKLKRCLGSDAVLSLVYLWLYTAENRPHGELRGMDEDDIIVAAQWDGGTEIFINTLLEMEFMDKKNNLFVIHDWKKNNPYAAHAPERKKRAQTAARAKWSKNKDKKVCAEHKQALLPAELSNAPSPSPSPSPSPKKKTSCRQPSGDHQIFIAWWVRAYELSEEQKYFVDGKQAKHVADMLKSIPLEDAISRAANFIFSEDPFYEGKKDISFFRSQINKISNVIDRQDTENLRKIKLLPPEGIKFTKWKFWEANNV